MAIVAVTSLMRTIELEFLQPKPRVVVQNKELIISIHQKLDNLLAFLDEREKKADKGAEMRVLMARIREVAFKAEDAIEAAVQAALDEAEMLRGGDSFYKDYLFPLAKCATTMGEAFWNLLQQVMDNLQVRNKSNTAFSPLISPAERHKTLDQTLPTVLHSIQELMDIIEKDNSQVPEDSSVHHMNISSRHSSKLDEDAIMVGHSEEFKKVMADIFQPSLQQRQVMALVGMGGIGKTTFSRKIYDDPRVASHFNLRGWATVSQKHSVKQMLLELGRSISSKPEDTNVNNLKEYVRKSLLGQKYLIIVDGIWTEKAWDEIQTCFPDENNGSRIILTTHQKEVAEYANAGEDGPSFGDHSSVLHVNISNAGSSQHSSKFDEDATMVGHLDEFEDVIAHIFESSLQQRHVTTLVGMGEIEMKTFSRKIYADPRVASHFNLRGWTIASQQHSVTQMLLELRRSISSKPEDAAQLRQNLLGQRYLIIVDGIWTDKAWDEIHTCFPDENNGSRIILNTHQKEVAEYADAGEDGPSSGDSSVIHLNISNVGSSQHSSNFDEDATMVGHSAEFERVMDHIFQSSLQQRQVMTLVGMGGIEMTTFLKKIYDDHKVASHFNLRGWTTVSQQHSVKQMLHELSRSIRSKPENTNAIDAAQLRQSLLGQRYLIILDDIWTKTAWDEIQTCFPNENNGSRIILTTRQKEVAEYADAGKYSIEMRFLDTDEGWKLFYQKLNVKEPLNKDFETVGKNIVTNCKGLPLAIALLAGLLSTTSNKSLDEWKNVETTINPLVDLDTIGEQFYSRIFTLSYNSLPHYLKGCFLYLGVFPKNKEIPIKKLIRLWIAERLITPRDGKRLEEVGEDYCNDLINRSLVMICGQSFDGKIKTCKIHDFLHALCVDKIKNEKLLCVHLDDNNCISDPDNRWLTFRDRYPKFDSLNPSLIKVRSIFYLDMNHFSSFIFQTKSFIRLRVLDLGDLRKLDGIFPNEIVDLVFLRYLALSSNRLLCCEMFWRNWNLQTLIINNCFPQVNRPSRRIWDLPQLRHLKLHYEISMNPPEVVQENLQTFYWFHDFWCSKQVLLSIPNVKELGIIAKGEQLHPIDNLYHLNHLAKLTIRGGTYPHRPSLKLPPHADAFPLNIKKLTIMWISMQWEDMTVVSMLPNLEVLKLKENIYRGQEWELIEETGFPRLKFLLISSSNLRSWKADIGNHFLVLERLHMKNCYELEEMPSWIEGIYTLQLMEFDKCGQSLLNSAKQIQEERRQSYGDYGLVIKEL